MSVTSIRLTYFQTEKLRCASGQQSAPYRITTYKGPEVGMVGYMPAVICRMHGSVTVQAANESEQEYRSQPLWQRLAQRIAQGLARRKAS